MIFSLRDDHGKFFQATRSDVNGRYDFAVPAADYYVVPEPDRLWNSNPGQLKLRPDNVVGTGDFQMRFVPAEVSFTGVELSFVMITTYSYTPLIPPEVGFGHETVVAYTYVIDKLVPRHSMGVPGGHVYWFKCWVPAADGYHVKYIAGAPQVINGGNTLWPLDQVTEACP